MGCEECLVCVRESVVMRHTVRPIYHCMAPGAQQGWIVGWDRPFVQAPAWCPVNGGKKEGYDGKACKQSGKDEQ